MNTRQNLKRKATQLDEEATICRTTSRQQNTRQPQAQSELYSRRQRSHMHFDRRQQGTTARHNQVLVPDSQEPLLLDEEHRDVDKPGQREGQVIIVSYQPYI